MSFAFSVAQEISSGPELGNSATSDPGSLAWAVHPEQVEAIYIGHHFTRYASVAHRG